MTDSSLLDMSISLMLHGMGVVFAFLVLAIFLISAMSKVIQRYFQPNSVEPSVPPPGSRTSGVDPQTLKAIQMALDKHRHRQR